MMTRDKPQNKEQHMSTTVVVTNGEVLAQHGIPAEGIEHLDLDVPVLTEPQRQGDVLIVPCAPRNGGTPIPKAGVTVVRGESANRNAHILHNLDGECQWEASLSAGSELLQGWLTVPLDASATLIHTEEHNVLAIGCGCYEIRGQREMAGVWRRIAD